MSTVDGSGAAKLLVTSRVLRARRDTPELFSGYAPLEVTAHPQTLFISRPDAFGRALVMSPALWWSGDEMFAYGFKNVRPLVSDDELFLAGTSEVPLASARMIRSWLPAIHCALRITTIAPDPFQRDRVYAAVAFGGADLKTLYITSAWQGFDAAQRAADPHAGALFSVRTDVAGLPVARFG